MVGKVHRGVLTALMLIVITCLIPASAFAQENPDTKEPGNSTKHTVDSGGPDYLNPVSNTADLNLLAAIFGNIARAAAGQIDLADIVIDEKDGYGEQQTDSAIATMMYIYLMGIMGITGFVLVLLIAAMAVQAGIEGKVLTQRYNEWAAIRTVYAIFAMLPVLGGWSIGQYAILNATFYVNTITNEMDRAGSQWVFAKGSTNSVDIDPFEYRKVVEVVYLNEICAQINNKEADDWKTKQENYITMLNERIYSGLLPQETLVQLNKSADWLTARFDIGKFNNKRITGSFAEKDSVTNEEKTYLTALYQWGNPSTSSNSCGEIKINFGQFKNDDVNTSQRTLDAYYTAHKKALKDLTSSARTDVEGILSKVNEIASQTSTFDKEQRESLIREEAEKDLVFSAFGKAFDDLAPMSLTAIDKLYAQRVAEYASNVSDAYKKETESFEKLFVELLNEIAKRQREGSTADYKQMYKEASLELDPKFNAIASEEVRLLLENTSKGWMYAGYKWWDLSRALTNQLALQKHKPESNLYTNYGTGLPTSAKERIDVFTQTYNLAKASRQFKDMNMVINGETIEPTPLNEEFAEQKASSGDTKEATNNFKLGFGNWMTRSLTAGMFKDFKTTDLLSNVQNAGHIYINIGESLLAIATTLKITAAVAKTGGGWALKAITLGQSDVLGETISETLKSFITTLLWGAYLFLAVGFLYAVYLPLLPAMIWTFGIIGWLEKLISLIIIFPVWMLGHIIPDGDGLINGVGRQGYVLAANVLFRPPVMLLSLYFSMATMGAIGYFISGFVTVFMPSANGDHTTGVMVGVFSFIVLSGFLVVIIHMLLAWIYKIPDELPNYIGGSGSNFGESEGRSHANAISGIVFSQTQSLNSMMGGGKDPNQKPNKSGEDKTKQGSNFGNMAV